VERRPSQLKEKVEEEERHAHASIRLAGLPPLRWTVDGLRDQFRGNWLLS
jgi:hypothetical protein